MGHQSRLRHVRRSAAAHPRTIQSSVAEIKANDRTGRKESFVKGVTCMGTLSRIHRSLRADPFRISAGVLAGKPKPIGVRCQACRQPVQRAYSVAQLTGWVFGYFACACTILSQLGQRSPTQRRNSGAKRSLKPDALDQAPSSSMLPRLRRVKKPAA
jgi:hypothetical protein